ncbi:hypothetical protein Tsedi_02026 [Tepidimonas sediminis]|uniref:DUF1640 domain-containing protein n=1 Tax=Tepidimonas sediminis TaxID=2588941 RepID=A0A554WLA2_9BURK|nr:DUF1640 domain-containing protein [Tepidimonas sediminis]TSE24372.1 hypothetical protein Tsedi_02026 [Tepidimonas sediminis]
MSVVTFDTLKFVERLEKASFSREQPAAIAGAFREATGEEPVTRSCLDARLSERKRDVHSGPIEPVKWFAGLLLAQAALIAALVKLL